MSAGKPVIAFYAPMKSPRHPVPSGDRHMARLFMKILEMAGFDVKLASEFRSYEGKGDEALQQRLKQEAEEVAATLIQEFAAAGEAERPTIWFSYHLYHKAPDWIGPAVARALDIPYVVAEASHAPKQAGGKWALGYHACESVLRATDLVLAMTRLDSACLAPLMQRPDQLVFFPPFLEAAPFAKARIARDAHRQELAAKYNLDPGIPWILTVAMMREGDKFASYHLLAEACRLLDKSRKAEFVIVGDGARRQEVEGLFADTTIKPAFLGQFAAEDLPAVYGACDLYIWPAVNEAYGMAYLEAQAAGLPVIAGDERGVSDVVRPRRSALLCPPRNAEALARALGSLISNPAEVEKMSRAASEFAGKERNVDRAALALGQHLARLLETRAVKSRPEKDGKT